VRICLLLIVEIVYWLYLLIVPRVISVSAVFDSRLKYIYYIIRSFTKVFMLLGMATSIRRASQY
jgi:hypothetical protein